MKKHTIYIISNSLSDSSNRFLEDVFDWIITVFFAL